VHTSAKARHTDMAIRIRNAIKIWSFVP